MEKVNVEEAPVVVAPPILPVVVEVVPTAVEGGDELVPEKTEYHYNGKLVEALEMRKLANVPIQVPEVMSPKMKGKWGDIKSSKLPKLLIITNAEKSPYSDKATQISYVGYKRNFAAGVANVPNDFKLKALTGRMSKKMMEAYDAHKLANLGQQLASTGFFIGSDPEVFVEDDKGMCIPAFEFLDDKEGKSRTRAGSQGGKKMYWDGFQAEFETQAQSCLAYHCDSIYRGLGGVYDAAKKYNKKAKLSIKNVMDVPYNVLQEAEEKYVALGCMPSLNIYGLEGKIAPPRELPFRSAGGHIHFGISKQSPEMVSEIVKSLDAILGVSCVSLFASFDNPVRREFYGLPGEHRLPKHGLEYRALSNAMLSAPAITNIVFDLARKALILGQKNLRKHWQASEEETIDIMKYCDVARARKVMEKNKDMLVSLLKAAYPTGKAAETAYNVFYNGLESAVKEPENIIKNWHLDGGWLEHCGHVNSNWSSAWIAIAAGKKI